MALQSAPLKFNIEVINGNGKLAKQCQPFVILYKWRVVVNEHIPAKKTETEQANKSSEHHHQRAVNGESANAEGNIF